MSKILLIGMLAGSAFDVGTTDYALSHPGVYEANPLMRNRGVRITVNVVVPFMLYKMIKGKSTKVQLGVAGSYIAAKTFVGIHNLREVRK